MHAGISRTDEGPFQMQTEDAVPAGDRPGCCNGGSHLLTGVADQGGQTPRGAVATVRPGDGAHAVGGRLIVQKDTTATVDLQIDEAGSKESSGGQTRLRPIGGNIGPGP